MRENVKLVPGRYHPLKMLHHGANERSVWSPLKAFSIGTSDDLPIHLPVTPGHGAGFNPGENSFHFY